MLIDKLYNSWNEIKNCESGIWILAPKNILEIKKDLLLNMSKLSQKLNSLNNNSDLIYSEKDLLELIKLGTEIQKTLSEYLKYYREELEKI